MNTFTFRLFGCFILSVASYPLHALQITDSVSTKNQIIEKMIAAYGGDTLLHANSIKVVDYNKGPWAGEGETPDIPELWRINEELTIDYKNKRKSLLSYRVPRTTIDLEKWVQQGDTTIVYDILHEKYSREDWANFDRLGASLERSSDTLQAKRLYGITEQLRYVGDEYFRGRLQQKLVLDLPSTERYTYFIDKTSGFINKILRQHPTVGELLYVFSNHNTNSGVVYARDMNFFVNGQLRLLSVHRDVQLTPKLDEAFSGFANYTYWGETFDDVGLIKAKLSDKVVQLGEGRSLTVFIEQPDHYIALGAADRLTDNFAELKKMTQDDKPLKYFVVSHHHNANVRGLNNAIALGATLVVAEPHKNEILKHITSISKSENILVVPPRASLLLGNVKLFDIATAHSRHFLLAYVTNDKMVIADDHYVTNLVKDKPRVYHDMVRFVQALDTLNIDVKLLVDSRGLRQFSIEDLQQWTKEFTPKQCPEGYAICVDG